METNVTFADRLSSEIKKMSVLYDPRYVNDKKRKYHAWNQVFQGMYPNWRSLDPNERRLKRMYINNMCIRIPEMKKYLFYCILQFWDYKRNGRI